MDQCNCSKEKEIATLVEQIKAIFKRMDEQNQQAKALFELSSDVKVLTNAVKTLQVTLDNDVKADIKRLEATVEELRMKPGKQWQWFLGMVGGALIAAIMALVMRTIGL